MERSGAVISTEPPRLKKRELRATAEDVYEAALRLAAPLFALLGIHEDDDRQKVQDLKHIIGDDFACLTPLRAFIAGMIKAGSDMAAIRAALRALTGNVALSSWITDQFASRALRSFAVSASPVS